MEKQLIISVGREYGSGGHEIAERLSKHYGIQLLDHNLLDEIAADKNLDMQDLRGLDAQEQAGVEDSARLQQLAGRKPVSAAV